MSAHNPDPWEWWTSNSWRRLRHSDRGVSTDVIMPTVHPDGQPDLIVSDADAGLIDRAWEIPGLVAEIAALKARNQTAYATQNELLAALRLFDEFGWTAVVANCDEAKDELNRRVAVARAVINKLDARQ